MLDKSIFDPDVQDQVAEYMSPAEFGIQVARIFQESPSSGNWAVAGKTIEAVTGWSPDWDQAKRLIERISTAAIPSPNVAEVVAGKVMDIPCADSRRLRNTVMYALRSLLDSPRRGALESTENTDLLSLKELEALVSSCDPDAPVDMQCVVDGGLVQSFGSNHPLAYLLEGVSVIDFDDDDSEPDAFAKPLEDGGHLRPCRLILHAIDPSEVYRVEQPVVQAVPQA